MNDVNQYISLDEGETWQKLNKASLKEVRTAEVIYTCFYLAPNERSNQSYSKKIESFKSSYRELVRDVERTTENLGLIRERCGNKKSHLHI